MNKYNTQRDPLLHKEYGRNIQNLTKYISGIEDDEERTKYAYTLIKLMKQVIPDNTQAETDQKYWDDLQVISGFNLNIDAPFPIPDIKTINKKPAKVPYRKDGVKLKHYGRNVELLIEKAIALEDPEEKEIAVIYIGKLMKTFQSSGTNEIVDDSVIIKNMKRLSNNALTIELEKVTAGNLFEVLYKSKNKPRNSNSKRGSNHKNYGRNQNKNSRNQNRRRRS